jgi:thioesterase domain-containing protein/NAD(P)-dependent dehydrogenase (short-subunit alcohol dehydrogenase family)/acyl carrier protein
MIGHSMGEYTAAHLAGVFSLADALTLVELRGRLFESLPEGGMLSVPMAEAEVQPLMTPELSISVINGPRMTVVGGPVKAIEALQQRLAGMEVEAARVRINVAAHSSMLEPILKEFGAFFQRIAMKAPTLPFVSNLSGDWITPAEATDPQYWVRHLRNTVRFADGLQELLKDDSRILLEVGPGRTLSSLARQHPARPATQPVLNSMRHPDEAVSDQAFALTVLGRLWGLGAPVDWAKFRGNEKRLRVELPSYCFDHQRHWVEPGKGAHAVAAADRALHKRKDLAEWFYQPVWKRAGVPLLPALQVEDDSLRVRTLVLADTLGFGARLAERMRAEGSDVVMVQVGKAYRREGNQRFTINPRSAADYDRLMATLNGEGRPPQRIVHLWTLTGSAVPAGTLAEAEELQALGFYSLLNLAQAIGREDLSDPIRLAVVSDHLQRVATESALVPAKATMLGPVKVIPREFTNVRCQSIDIEIPAVGSRIEALLLDSLVAELSSDLGDDVVAYRAAQRWVQDYEAAPLPPVVGMHKRLRQRGTYLITGGLGGVGLALAEHLARAVKARLVLVGRHGLPERSEWAQCLAQAGDDPARARRIRQVMALESLGAEVMVAGANVTDLAQMKAVVKQARARFGTIHGVLHTAGVLNDGVIQLKEPQVAASVLAPKLQGTLVLEAALSDGQGKAPLDFCVLFSSISAFAGLAGQIDYAAANAFLDAYAQDRFARDATYTVAVNWSQWQEVGMAAELAHQLGMDGDALSDTAGTELGLPLLDRCLLDTPDERVYSTRFSLDKHWLLSEHRVLGGEALIPGTGYLELVRTAFTQLPSQHPVELRDVTFLAPFVVREGEQRDLRIHLRSRSGGATSFSVVSRAVSAEAAGTPWVENVRGTVRYIDETVPATDGAVAIGARCRSGAKVFDGSEKQAHLLFGPRWSNIERIDFGQGEALVSLRMPVAHAADLSQFPLHPALMDMATGGAQALIPGFDESRDFFVPASYGRLRVFAPLTARLSSHVRYRKDENGGDDLALYDVTILDEQGRVAVDIEGFTMIRVRDKSLLARVGNPTGSAHTAAKPRATANNILAVGLRDGILSSEGAEVLTRVLAWGGGPQVAVSPQDLVTLLAQLRLPAQTSGDASAGDDNAETAPGWKAPSTETEKLIAQMWGEMLGHSKVSASDDFFDLGGHSLLAVQVINKLKKRTGKALPLTALLEAPTVESLAALIEPPGSAQASSSADPSAPKSATPLLPRSNTLIQIRPGDTDKLPIFFVHDGLGETLLYRSLALQLNPGHAVFGIQPEVNEDGSYVQTRIVDWAAAHVRKLRSVQEHGPYLLAGLCAGGVIAFEMARQLQETGEQTLFLGIMDAADVRADERPFRLAKEKLNRFLGTLDSPEGGSVLGRLGRALPKMVEKGANFVSYEISSRLDRLQNARKVKQLRESGQAHEETGDHEAPGINYLQLYEHAHKEHQPTGRFRGGDVVLYRAMKGDGSVPDVAYADVYSDPLLGWAPRVEGTVASVDVPGGHSSMLQAPNVQVLAEQMRQHIAAALAKRQTVGQSTAAAAGSPVNRTLGMA